MPGKHKLFDQFPPVTKEEWLEKIKSDLKGEDFEKRLVWKTDEGFSVMPFYTHEDTSELKHTGRFLYRKEGRWRIRQDISVTDYKESNEKANFLVKNGVDSIGFVISDPDSISIDNFKNLLRGINCKEVELNFLSNGKAREIVDILTNLEFGTQPYRELLTGAVEADPLGRLMLNGTLCIPVSDGFDYLAALVKESSPIHGLRAIQVNGSNFANAGADCVTELAFSISMACEYLNQLTDRGVSPDLAVRKIRFSFAAGSTYFMEIAKLRAARIVWPAVADKFLPDNQAGQSMIIHSVTSRWNKTLFDPYVNLIRTQAEAMAAVLGGADSVTVEPFDVVFRRPDEFSERLARNQQLLLKEEAFFDKVSDPSAGSWYIENLTSLVAENAWKLFVEIEEKGGFISALRAGTIQRMIHDEAERQKSDALSGHRHILGTNLYPNPRENMHPMADERILFTRQASAANPEVEPLRISRLAEEMERHRLETEKLEMKSNKLKIK
ncbi:MAG: methylmalonyl-CoA mutase small subunit [Bacteroidales bacterium]|nr:methylmalonyl-CoA mutase small subunit [Bacteroidales bacterium]